MPIKKFVIIDFLSAWIWAPAYIFPGMILAHFSAYLTNSNILITISTGLAILFFIWLSYWLLTRRYSFVLVNLKNMAIENYNIILNEPRKKILLYVMYALFNFSLFILLLILVTYDQSINLLNTEIHQYILLALQNIPQQFISTFTKIGSKTILVPFFFTMTIILIMLKQYKLSILWFSNGFLLGASTWLSKRFFIISRPELSTNIELYSYPSAHVSLFIGLIGLYLYID